MNHKTLNPAMLQTRHHILPQQKLFFLKNPIQLNPVSIITLMGFQTEIGLLDFLVFDQFLGAAGERHAAPLQDIGSISNA